MSNEELKFKYEPLAEFKRAVVKRENGFVTYSYYKLIDICMKTYELDYNYAKDWVDITIERLAIDRIKICYKR